MAAILNTQWYVNYGNGSSTGYYALAVWATAHTYAVGDIVRPLTAPAVGNERAYICTTAGLSVTEPTWTFTKGALQTGTVEKFNECTGQAALNGDITTCPIWVASSTYLLGMVVMNVARNGFFIATSVSGTGTSGGSEPAGLTTPVLGATTTDNSGANQVVWTCIKATGTAFAAWGAPHARLRKAYTATWGAAGDWFYIGDDHAETEAAAMSLTSPGTFALPCRVICVSHTGSTPPVSADLATTATISTTGTNGLSITSGSAYHYGIIFNCGTGSSSVSLSFCQDAVPCVHRFVSCSFVLVNTAAG